MKKAVFSDKSSTNSTTKITGDNKKGRKGAKKWLIPTFIENTNSVHFKEVTGTQSFLKDMECTLLNTLNTIEPSDEGAHEFERSQNGTFGVSVSYDQQERKSQENLSRRNEEHARTKQTAEKKNSRRIASVKSSPENIDTIFTNMATGLMQKIEPSDEGSYEFERSQDGTFGVSVSYDQQERKSQENLSRRNEEHARTKQTWKYTFFSLLNGPLLNLLPTGPSAEELKALERRYGYLAYKRCLYDGTSKVLDTLGELQKKATLKSWSTLEKDFSFPEKSGTLACYNALMNKLVRLNNSDVYCQFLPKLLENQKFKEFFINDRYYRPFINKQKLEQLKKVNFNNKVWEESINHPLTINEQMLREDIERFYKFPAQTEETESIVTAAMILSNRKYVMLALTELEKELEEKYHQNGDNKKGILSSILHQWARQNNFTGYAKLNAVIAESVMLKKVFSEGYLFKDKVTPGSFHGAWTHFIQWYIIGKINEINKKTKEGCVLKVEPADLLRWIGKQENGGEIWNKTFELFSIKSGDVDPYSLFDPSGTARGARHLSQLILDMDNEEGLVQKQCPLLYSIINERENNPKRTINFNLTTSSTEKKIEFICQAPSPSRVLMTGAWQ